MRTGVSQQPAPSVSGLLELAGTTLYGADMTGAKIKREQFRDVKTILGATLPNGRVVE